nr:hypothetical protein [Tanacetum cinerariifolium]
MRVYCRLSEDEGYTGEKMAGKTEKEELEDEEEFEEEEPQEAEENMEVDIGEEENEPELTFSYEEADPINLSPPAFDSESEDVVEVEDMIEPEDETVPGNGMLNIQGRYVIY